MLIEENLIRLHILNIYSIAKIKVNILILKKIK